MALHRRSCHTHAGRHLVLRTRRKFDRQPRCGGYVQRISPMRSKRREIRVGQRTEKPCDLQQRLFRSPAIPRNPYCGPSLIFERRHQTAVSQLHQRLRRAGVRMRRAANATGFTSAGTRKQRTHNTECDEDRSRRNRERCQCVLPCHESCPGADLSARITPVYGRIALSPTWFRHAPEVPGQWQIGCPQSSL